MGHTLEAHRDLQPKVMEGLGLQAGERDVCGRRLSHVVAEERG